jgi:hypothetical protein
MSSSNIWIPPVTIFAPTPVIITDIDVSQVMGKINLRGRSR